MNSTVLVAALGITGTLLAALLSPLITWLLSVRHERQKWSRETRLDAYSRFSQLAYDAAYHRLHNPVPSMAVLVQKERPHGSVLENSLVQEDVHLDYWQRAIAARWRLLLVASPRVRAAAEITIEEVKIICELSPRSKEEQEQNLLIYSGRLARTMIMFDTISRQELGFAERDAIVGQEERECREALQAWLDDWERTSYQKH